MAIYIQDFVMAIMELLISVLKLIKPVYDTIFPHIRSEVVGDLLRSIEPLVDWLLSMIPLGIDPLLRTFENETVSQAFIDVFNSTSEVNSHGLTHIVNGTAYVFENEASYNYIGSQFIYTLFEFLSWIIERMASLMYELPEIIPWV